MSIHLLTEKISRVELKTIAQESFEVMVKAVVDVEKGVLALGGELHADANVALLARGSEKVLPDLVLCGREVGEERAQGELPTGQHLPDNEQPQVGSQLLVEEILDFERAPSRVGSSTSSSAQGWNGSRSMRRGADPR